MYLAGGETCISREGTSRYERGQWLYCSCSFEPTTCSFPFSKEKVRLSGRDIFKICSGLLRQYRIYLLMYRASFRGQRRGGGGVFGGTRPASWMSETVRRASREYKVLHSNALSRESEVALQVCRFFRFALRKASLGYQVA